jgi:hypothetical protein
MADIVELILADHGRIRRLLAVLDADSGDSRPAVASFRGRAGRRSGFHAGSRLAPAPAEQCC